MKKSTEFKTWISITTVLRSGREFTGNEATSNLALKKNLFYRFVKKIYNFLISEILVLLILSFTVEKFSNLR
jgi:hypothetical protein